MITRIMLFPHEAQRALKRGARLQDILNLEVREQIARARYIAEDDLASMDKIETAIREEITGLTGEDSGAQYA